MHGWEGFVRKFPRESLTRNVPPPCGLLRSEEEGSLIYNVLLGLYNTGLV